MPNAHNTKWYGVDDAKIFLLLTDPESPGSATYDDPIDVPGMKSVGISGTINSNELRGDGKRLDYQSRYGGRALTFEFAKSALDVFAAIGGHTVSDTGTTPNMITKMKIGEGDFIPYFKFVAQTVGVDLPGGDGQLVIYKAILSTPPSLGMEEEDYKTYEVGAECMGTIASEGDDLIDVLYHETKVAIA
jgi:hypothetical protein